MSTEDKRRRLYGKIATEEEIANEIVKLLLGNPEKKIQPKNISQIAVHLGYKERKSVYYYLEIAEKLNLITKDENGRYTRPQKTAEQEFREFSENHPILEDTLVQEWDADLRTRGHTGKGVKNRKTRITSLERFCNELRINPIQIVQSKESLTRYLTSYRDGLYDGTIKRKIRSVNSSEEMAFMTIKSSVCQFAQMHGIALPKGQGGILSRKVLSHGNYADIRFTDEQFKEADRYIIEKFGLDSDFYRLFWVGVESCSRHDALFNMDLTWSSDVDDEKNETTFFMTAYEKKTEHIKGGKWTKYITRPETQQSLAKLKERNTSTKIWDESKWKKPQIEREFTKMLKELYKHLGLTHFYWFEHAIHALRHVGAQYWLKLTWFDYGYVCELGGWNTMQELKKSYGEMPPEMMIQKMKRYRSGIINTQSMEMITA